MIRLLLLSFAFCTGFVALSAEARPKIGLVLSGGGAKGAAHIAVLKVLEAQHIPVDYIAGTSIGAYVGGLYALGYSADEIEKIMYSKDWNAGFSDTIPRADLSYRNKQQRDRFNIPINIGYSDNKIKLPNGILRGQTMSMILRNSTDLVSEFTDFDALTIPFRAVATDLETSKAVVIDSGSIVEAMQASATVPGVLQAAEYKGRIVVDGGIANNLPIDVVKGMGADIVIAVDIGSSLVNRQQLDSTVAVLDQLSTMLTNASTKQQKQLLTKQDVLIRPNVDKLDTTDFSTLGEAYQQGKQATLAQLDRLQSLSINKADYDAYRQKKQVARRKWQQNIRQKVIEIRVDNNSKIGEKLLRDTFGIKVGQVVDKAELQHAINNIYALDKFERVSVEFIDKPKGRIVLLKTEAKSWGPNYFQLGFSWEDNFSFDSFIAVDVAYTLTDLTDYGGEWRNELRFGFEKLIGSEFYMPLDSSQTYFSRSKFSFIKKEWQFYQQDKSMLDLNQTNYQLETGLGINYLKEGTVELGLVQELGSLKNIINADDQRYRSYGGYLKFGFDDLNSINFPTSGNRFTFDMYYRHDNVPESLTTEPVDNTLQIDANWRGALSINHHAFVGIASFATVNQSAPFSIHISELGGFLNLSGYHKNALVGKHKVFGAFVYQYDLGGDVIDMADYPLYLGASIEAGNVWQLQKEVSLTDLIYSGSLYIGTDTTVGPAAIGFGWSDDGNQSLFLFLGKNW